MNPRRFKAFIAVLLLCAATRYGLGAEAVYNAAVTSEKILQTGRDAVGQKIAYPRAKDPEVTALRVVIPAGQETGWHTHSAPGYAYVLSGTLTLEYEGGTTRQFAPGAAFAEVVKVPHNGRNAGPEDVTLVVFFTGEAGAPFTKKTSPPAVPANR